MPRRPVDEIDRVKQFAELPDSFLLTREQVAKISGFAVITLKKWAMGGKGPKITRIEGLPRFRVADVREWMRGEVYA